MIYKPNANQVEIKKDKKNIIIKVKKKRRTIIEKITIELKNIIAVVKKKGMFMTSKREK